MLYNGGFKRFRRWFFFKLSTKIRQFFFTHQIFLWNNFCIVMFDYLKLLFLNVFGDHSEFKQNNQQVYKSDTIYWIKPCCLWDDGLWNEGRICEIELILWRKVPEISGTSGHRKRGQRTCRSARCHRYRRLVNSTSFWKHFCSEVILKNK